MPGLTSAMTQTWKSSPPTRVIIILKREYCSPGIKIISGSPYTLHNWHRLLLHPTHSGSQVEPHSNDLEL